MTLLTSPPIPLRRPRSAQPPFGARLSPRFSRKAAFAIYGDSYLDLVTGKFAGDSPLTGSWSRQSVANALGPAIKTDWQANGPINPARWAWDARQDFGTGDFTVVYVGVIPSDTVSGNNLSNSGGLTNQWRFQTNYLANGTNAGTYTTTAGALSMLLYDGAFFSIGATGMCDGKPHCYVFVRRGTAHELWMDGVLKASGTSSALDVNSTKQVGIATAWQLNGTLSSGSGWYAANHTMNFAAGFREALSGASLSSDPWQLLRVADTTPRFALARGREPVSVRESVLLPTSGPTPSEVAPVAMNRRIARVLQPAGAVQVDRRTRAGAAISTLIPFNGSNRDLVTGTPLVAGSGTSIVPGPRGLSLRGNGAGTYHYIPINLSQQKILSLSFLMYWDAFANDDALAMEFTANSNTNNGAFFIDPNTGPPFPGLFSIVTTDSSSVGLSTIVRPSAAAWHHYAFVIDRNFAGGGRPLVRFAWVDGQSVALTSQLASLGSPTTFANDNLYFLSRSGTSLRAAGNLQNVVLRTGYYLTDSDVKNEYQNPWSLFAPLTQPLWGDR